MESASNELLITPSGAVYFNDDEYENAEWELDNKNNLVFTGDMLREKRSWDEIDDEFELSLIEDKYIKTRKTFWRKRLVKYIPLYTWYVLKERIPKKIKTNNFIIIDKRTEP
jgi:hypothetical protein